MFISGKQEVVYMVQHRTLKGQQVIKLQTDSGVVVTLERDELAAIFSQMQMVPLTTKSTT